MAAPEENLGGLFEQFFGESHLGKKRPEKGVPWHAKVIDGEYYVPLSDVLALLKENDILPAVQRGLEKRING